MIQTQKSTLSLMAATVAMVCISSCTNTDDFNIVTPEDPVSQDVRDLRAAEENEATGLKIITFEASNKEKEDKGQYIKASIWGKMVVSNWAPGKFSTTTVLPPAWDNKHHDPTKVYKWECPTTHLSSIIVPSLSWGKGYPWFVSSYNSSDLSGKGDFMHDLYVYNSDPSVLDSATGGGNNGSDHFLITYGYQEDNNPYMKDDGRPILHFPSNVEKQIMSLYVNSTTYFMNVVLNGNSLSPKLEEGEEVYLHAYGYDARGRETGHLTLLFADKNNVVKEWTKWDLSKLGKINMLKINMTGGTNNGYGFSLPAYYAIDDIAIMNE